ncbi:MAG: restriction endonuclease subunit S [Chloroflexi bacterium]|nr:restriction endonuclease subunit S [Chloroflexota bacterium]
MPAEILFDSLPEDWEYTTLGEACKQSGGEIQTGPFGSQLHAADYVDSGIPSIMPLNLGDNYVIEEGIARISTSDAQRLARYLVRTGDIVYSRRGDVERRALIRKKEDGWLCGTGCLRVRFGNGRVDPVFASYYLDHPAVREWIVRHAHGATMPNLNTTILSETPFVVPPLPEQRAIAHILGTLDDKIELNRRMNETLEAMARALFKSWFVDFDPVRRNMARVHHGRGEALPSNPDMPELRGNASPLLQHPPIPFVSDEIDALFPDDFEDSALGKIPRGWRVAPLPQIIDVNPTRMLRRGVIAPYIDMANMPTQGHSPSNINSRAFGSGMRFMNGDTLVARITPCLENGKTAFIDCLEPEQVGWGSTEYIVLHPKEPLPAEFAYCLARSTEFRDFAIQRMTGSSGRQRVPVESLSFFSVVVAPKPITHLFGKLVKPIFVRANVAAGESRTLATIRDILLPKLLSGTIRIEDADRFMR